MFKINFNPNVLQIGNFAVFRALQNFEFFGKKDKHK